jgi:hypothetical protein
MGAIRCRNNAFDRSVLWETLTELIVLIKVINYYIQGESSL